MGHFTPPRSSCLRCVVLRGNVPCLRDGLAVTAFAARRLKVCHLHFILCRMCVCHMFNKVLTYLLTYLLTVTDRGVSLAEFWKVLVFSAQSDFQKCWNTYTNRYVHYASSKTIMIVYTDRGSNFRWQSGPAQWAVSLYPIPSIFNYFAISSNPVTVWYVLIFSTLT